MNLNQLLLIIFFQVLTHTRLVLLKNSLQKQFDKDIDYQLAPFGKYPYGRELYGLLHYQEQDSCTSFEILTSVNQNEYQYLLLLDKGNCSPKLQALNAEHADSKMLIIIKEENEDNIFEETHDQNNLVVNIPTISISFEDGQKLKQIIKTQGDVLVKFQMPVPQRDNVDVDIYMRLEEESMYRFMKNFQNYVEQLEDIITINIHLLPIDIQMIEDLAKLQVMMNCVPFEQQFDVMNLYYDVCVVHQNLKSQCFIDNANSMDPNSLSVFQKCYSSQSSQLSKVEEDVKKSSKQNQSHILINRKTFVGTLKPQNVFEAICGAYLKSPDSCLYLNNKYTANLQYKEIKKRSQKRKYIAIIICAILFVIFVIFTGIVLHLVYTKMYQKMISDNVQIIVRDYMSNYSSIDKSSNTENETFN